MEKTKKDAIRKFVTDFTKATSELRKIGVYNLFFGDRLYDFVKDIDLITNNTQGLWKASETGESKIGGAGEVISSEYTKNPLFKDSVLKLFFKPVQDRDIENRDKIDLVKEFVAGILVYYAAQADNLPIRRSVYWYFAHQVPDVYDRILLHENRGEKYFGICHEKLHITFEDFIKQKRTSIRDAFRFFARMLAITKFLHSNGICHYDINNRNIMMRIVTDGGGVVKYVPCLIDFGSWACDGIVKYPRTAPDIYSFEMADHVLKKLDCMHGFLDDIYAVFTHFLRCIFGNALFGFKGFDALTGEKTEKTEPPEKDDSGNPIDGGLRPTYIIRAQREKFETPIVFKTLIHNAFSAIGEVGEIEAGLVSSISDIFDTIKNRDLGKEAVYQKLEEYIRKNSGVVDAIFEKNQYLSKEELRDFVPFQHYQNSLPQSEVAKLYP